MLSPASPISGATHRPHAKASVLVAYIVCPILLFISAYGFWQSFSLLMRGEISQQEQLFYLFCLVVMPLALFLFLLITAAQRLEYNNLSASYQLRIDQMQRRLNHQEDFLHSITDNNPEAMTIFDRDNHFWFVNLSAASMLRTQARDIVGKPIDRVMNYEEAKKMELRLNEVRSTRRPIEMLHQTDAVDGKLRFIQTHYEPLAAFGDFTGGVIVRSEDVTNLIVERERRENMLRQVIGTLVAVVDRRDPYASGHSARVGQLSRAIAEEMVLGEKEIEASEIAGSLMNFGKVLVPREILTKTTVLTTEELQLIRDSILTSADILSIIDFVGPVVPTLKQVLERFDGTGVPQGLQGDQILATARIVTVANTFVAMVSPRAHRPSMASNDAVQNMLRDADKVYDRRVVMALSNYLENRTNKLDWLKTGKQS